MPETGVEKSDQDHMLKLFSISLHGVDITFCSRYNLNIRAVPRISHQYHQI